MFVSNIIKVVFVLAIVESAVWAKSTENLGKYSIHAYCVPKNSLDYLRPLSTAPMPQLTTLPRIDIDKLSAFLNHLGHFGILTQENGKPLYIVKPKPKAATLQLKSDCVEGESMFLFAIKPSD
ncbi:uncharacterized protein LOC126837052 [Adelges cooleyi]|uniref:uncharacterized protein LOC126837052 n=1 Tax=Adelges cooleyi TaxID=133065 RepID=UPI002180034B|nr:uncharacterized protein LOC126837052 [Adelges cooleyi]